MYWRWCWCWLAIIRESISGAVGISQSLHAVVSLDAEAVGAGISFGVGLSSPGVLAPGPVFSSWHGYYIQVPGTLLGGCGSYRPATAQPPPPSSSPLLSAMLFLPYSQEIVACRRQYDMLCAKALSQRAVVLDRHAPLWQIITFVHNTYAV